MDIEAEVRRRNVWEEYLPKLIDVVNEDMASISLGYSLGKRDGTWYVDKISGDIAGVAALIQATPEQKAEAFRRSVKP